MAKHLTALPGYWPGIPELVDSSRVLSTDLDYASMRAVVRAAIDKDKGLTTTKRISFFAPDDTNFGMARMFCTITDTAPEPIEAGAFRTEAEALGFVGRIETRLAEIPGYVAAFGG
ncbi:hypothetical protein [Primorskyibacter sp. 2E233]|uniref:hypothetical protein n=1 Tax=Primorskyibacter sp. 2E233 TaxID=3413431 RepID=UPI003BF3AF37